MQRRRPRRLTNPRHPPALAELLEPRTLLAAATDDGFAGELDLSFGADGVATDDRFGTATPYALARQSDGKLVVAGKINFPFGSSTDILLLRFNPDGSLDTAFGDNGRIVRDLGGALDAIRALVIDADGNLIAGGPGGFADFFLARFTPAGQLDTTFGQQGFIFTDFNRSDELHALVLQPDGKLLATGTAEAYEQTSRIALARYLPDGSLDPTFGDGGKVTVPGLPRATANAVALHPAGRVIVGANTIEEFQHAGHALVLAFTPDGAIDPTFGTNGVVTYRPRPTPDSVDNLAVKDLAIDSQGRILVASLGALGPYLTRLLPGGAFDDAFGGQPGIGRNVPMNPGVFNFDRGAAGYGLVVQPDDKPVIAHAGRSYDLFGPCTALAGPARFNVNGELDLDFGALGIGEPTKNRMLPAADMILLPDGDIVSVGASTTGKIMLVRHHLEGPPPLAVDDQKVATFLATAGDDDLELRTYACNADLGFLTLRRGTHQHHLFASRDVLSGFRILAGDGNDKISFNGQAAGQNPPGIKEWLPVTLFAGDGDDHVTHGFLRNAPSNLLDAGAGNDRLTLHSVYIPEPGFVGDLIDISGTQIKRLGSSGSTIDYAGFESLDSVGNAGFSIVAPAPTIPIDIAGGSLAIYVLPAAPVSFKPLAGRDTHLSVQAGTYTLPPNAPGFERTAISVGGTGAIELSGSPTFRTVTLNRSGRIVTAPGNHVLTVAGSLSLSGGTLDLADNTLIYRPPPHLNPVNELTRLHIEMFRTRYRVEGLWTGSGITSSTAAADRLTTLALFLNPGLATFKGKPVGPNDIIFTHTWNGDANLDGRVNADDYFLIDQGFLAQPTNPRFVQGDFNYDRRINADDYFLIDQAFLGQDPPVPGAAASPPLLSTTSTPTSTRPASDTLPSRPARKTRHRRPEQISSILA